MKKILFIHQWHSIGGAGISFYNTWKALQNKYDVVGYIPGNPPDLLNFLNSKGLYPKTYSFTCGQIPYYSGGSSINKPGFWYLLLKVFTQMSYWKKVIENEKPDLIMVNSKVLCWMSMLFKGTKSVCFVRETMKGNPFRIINKLMNMLLDNFTLVSFLSEYDLKQTNLKRSKTVVSPDFLYLKNYEDKLGKESACKKLNVDSNSFNIGFVGGIDKIKGLELALKAMSMLKDKNIKLIIAGNSVEGFKNIKTYNLFTKLKNYNTMKHVKKLYSFINEHNLNSCIKFVGVQEDVSILYSASDALIFPMVEPHQARPAFEIGVQKKPVIISDYPNIREYVKNGINGLTFEPNNPECLAQAIFKLKENKNMIEQLGRHNYDYTLQYHTEEYCMSALINKIEEILHES